MPTTFCTHCGTRFADDGWPRHCGHCGEFTYRNPTPVAIAAVPVTRRGLLVVRRDIEPKRGELCLPGGFMDYGETWQESVVRELREETGLVFGPDVVRLHSVHSSPHHVIVCGLLPEVEEIPTGSYEEVSEITTIPGPTELAFPPHTAVARDYFSGKPLLSDQR